MSDSYDAHDVTCRREHECDGCARSDEHYHYHYGDEVAG